MTFEELTAGVDRQADDCSVVAVAAVAGVSYNVASRVLRAHGRRDDDGTTDLVIRTALLCLGCTMESCYGNPPGPTIRTMTRNLIKLFPGKVFLIVTSDHIVAVVKGRLVDDSAHSDLLRVEYLFEVSYL